jgi:hypothetical protein
LLFLFVQFALVALAPFPDANWAFLFYVLAQNNTLSRNIVRWFEMPRRIGTSKMIISGYEGDEKRKKNEKRKVKEK